MLAVTGGHAGHSRTGSPPMIYGVTGSAVLADQGAWLAAWRPRPGEPGCWVPPALLSETQARRENAYFLWRSAVRASTDGITESRTARKPRSRRRDDAEQTGPARPRIRRRGSSAAEPDDAQD